MTLWGSFSAVFSPPPSSDREIACNQLFGYNIPQNEFEKAVCESYVPFIYETRREPTASLTGALKILLKNRDDHPRMERLCFEMLGFMHTGVIDKPTTKVKEIGRIVHKASTFLRTRSCDAEVKKKLEEVACVLDMHV